MYQKVLVTGASGFLGGHLFTRLRDLECEGDMLVGTCLNNGKWLRNALLTKCDITNEQEVGQLLRSFEPTHIFHLAANPLIKSSPSELLDSNLMGTYYLLKYAPKECQFVFASSAAVYGDMSLDHNWPCNEDDACLPTSTYGVCKLLSEKLVNEFTHAGKVRGVNLRLVANIGTGTTHGLVHDIIRKLKSDSQHLELIGDYPGSKKPLIHVEDTVDAMLDFMNWRDPVENTFNISTEDSLTVATVAHIVMEEIGIDKPIHWLGATANWRNDNPKVRVDNLLAITKGWQPECTTSELALRRALKEIIRG